MAIYSFTQSEIITTVIEQLSLTSTVILYKSEKCDL